MTVRSQSMPIAGFPGRNLLNGISKALGNFRSKANLFLDKIKQGDNTPIYVAVYENWTNSWLNRFNANST